MARTGTMLGVASAMAYAVSCSVASDRMPSPHTEQLLAADAGFQSARYWPLEHSTVPPLTVV